MKFSKAFLAFSSVVAVLLICGLGSDMLAQVKSGKTRPLKTKHLMSGLVKPNVGVLRKGEASSDEEWEALHVAASLLNETSYILMADGRCPDGTWKKAAEMMRSGSAEAIAGIAKKDLDATKKGVAGMMKSCGTCHKAHKKK